MAKEAAKEMLCYNSTKVLLPLMNEHGIRRFVLTGGASLEQPGDNNNFFINFMLTKVATKVLGGFVCRSREGVSASKPVRYRLDHCTLWRHE